MQSKQTPKHKLGNRKKRAAKSSLRSDGYESRKILDSLSLTILSERAQTEYARQRQNSKKKFQKLWATVYLTFFKTCRMSLFRVVVLNCDLLQTTTKK